MTDRLYPERWLRVRLRNIIKRALDPAQQNLLRTASQITFLPMEAIGEQGEIDISVKRSKEDVRTGYTLFFDGDVLVAKITPCFENGKGAVAKGLLNGVGFGTTELHVLSPTPDVDGRFLYYITASHQFRRSGKADMTGAAGQKRVPEEFVLNYRIGLPPLPEQRAIADFLGRETAKIDELLSEKKRLIELLAEKRRALITHAVTRGLDPDVSMHDSGVEWLGKIPGHWGKKFARWLFKEVDERSNTGEGELLTVSHLTGVTLRSEKEVNMFMAETLEGYKICQPGDLVINTLWAWMGAMGVAFRPGLVSPAYNVYRPLGQLEPRFVDYLVRIPIFAEEVTRYSKGVWSSRLRLYPEEFFQVVFPVPPIEEQRLIVDSMDREAEKMDSLNATTQETIKLLRERRAGLISAAVTGRVRVEIES